MQVRRVMEMVRVRVKRLKKFLAQRTEKEREKEKEVGLVGGREAGGKVGARQVEADHTALLPLPCPPPPPTSRSILTTTQCGGSFPDHLNADRFLCSHCMKLLEKRRTLLRSFYTKYIIGEGEASSSTPPTGPAHPSHHPLLLC